MDDGVEGTAIGAANECCKQLAEKLEKSEGGRKKLRQAIAMLKEKLEATKDLVKTNEALREEVELQRKHANAEKKKAEEERNARLAVENERNSIQDQLLGAIARIENLEAGQAAEKKEVKLMRTELKAALETVNSAVQVAEAAESASRKLESNVLSKVNGISSKLSKAAESFELAPFKKEILLQNSRTMALEKQVSELEQRISQLQLPQNQEKQIVVKEPEIVAAASPRIPKRPVVRNRRRESTVKTTTSATPVPGAGRFTQNAAGVVQIIPGLDFILNSPALHVPPGPPPPKVSRISPVATAVAEVRNSDASDLTIQDKRESSPPHLKLLKSIKQLFGREKRTHSKMEAKLQALESVFGRTDFTCPSNKKRKRTTDPSTCPEEGDRHKKAKVSGRQNKTSSKQKKRTQPGYFQALNKIAGFSDTEGDDDLLKRWLVARKALVSPSLPEVPAPAVMEAPPAAHGQRPEEPPEATRCQMNMAASDQVDLGILDHNRELIDSPDDGSRKTSLADAVPVSEVVKEPCYEVVKKPDYEVVKEPGSEVVKEPGSALGSEVVKEPCYEVVKKSDYEVVKEPGSEVVKEPGSVPGSELVKEIRYEVVKELGSAPCSEMVKEIRSEVVKEPGSEVVKEIRFEVVKELVKRLRVQLLSAEGLDGSSAGSLIDMENFKGCFVDEKGILKDPALWAQDYSRKHSLAPHNELARMSMLSCLVSVFSSLEPGLLTELPKFISEVMPSNGLSTMMKQLVDFLIFGNVDVVDVTFNIDGKGACIIDSFSVSSREASSNEGVVAGKLAAIFCEACGKFLLIQCMACKILRSCRKDNSWLIKILASMASISQRLFSVADNSILSRAMRFTVSELVVDVCNPAEPEALRDDIRQLQHSIQEDATGSCFEETVQLIMESMVGLLSSTEACSLSSFDLLKDLGLQDLDWEAYNENEATSWHLRFHTASLALEIVSLHMGWEWTYNELIIGKLWSLVAPGTGQVTLASVARLVGRLGRLNMDENGNELPGLYELRQSLAALLDHQASPKDGFSLSTRVVAAYSLLELSVVDGKFLEHTGNVGVKVVHEASVQLVRNWFKGLSTDEQEEVPARLKGKIFDE